MTPAEAAHMAAADRYALAGIVAGGIAFVLAVYALAREFRTAPLMTPQGEVVVPVSPTSPCGSTDAVFVTDKPVTPGDLMALRVVIARKHPNDQAAAELEYRRILAGIAADEADAGLDTALARIAGGA